MKHTRRYQSGGETESVYERAKRFLQKQGVTDATPALDAKIAEARKQMPAKSTPQRAPAPKALPQRAAAQRPPKPTPLQQQLINESRRLAAARAAREAETLRFENDTGMDIPFGLDTQYMGTQDRPLRYAKGGKVSSASKRADGIAKKGKTRGKVC